MKSFIEYLNEMYVRERKKQYNVLPTNINYRSRHYYDDLSRMEKYIFDYITANKLDIKKVKPESIKRKLNIDNFNFYERELSIKEVLHCLDYFLKRFLHGNTEIFKIAPRTDNINFMETYGYNYYIKKANGKTTKLLDIESHKKFIKDLLLHIDVSDFNYDSYEKSKNAKRRENTFVYVFEIKNVEQRFGYHIGKNKNLYLKFEFLYGNVNNIKNGYYPTVDTHTSDIIINCDSVTLNQISVHSTSPMTKSHKKYKDKLFKDAFELLKNS